MSAETNAEALAHPDPALPPTQPIDAESTDTAASLPAAPELPGSNSKSLSLPRLPTDIKSYASRTNEYISRLNKLIKTAGGLSAFLSTLNYAIYLLAHLHITSPSRVRLQILLSRYLGRTPSKAPPGAITPTAPTSPLLPLGALLSETRATLRLTGLLPLYVWLRSLLSTASTAPDPVTHSIAILQCISYMTYQIIENTAHLSGRNIVSKSFLDRNGGAGKFVVYSCRAWLAGISCDYLRLFRQAQVAATKRDQGGEKQLSKQEQDDVDRKWWNEFFVASCWFPMAIHYSVPQGIGLNLGAIGALGVMAGSGNFLRAWAATKD